MTYGTVVVCGGGCYGGYYVRQLARARAAGALQVERVLVVDQDPAARVAQLVSAVGAGDRDAIRRHVWRAREHEHGVVTDADVEACAALPLVMECANWDLFFARWFDELISNGGMSDHAVVPSPLMPNLLAGWVASRLQRHRPDATLERVPVAAVPVTPWRRTGDDGSHYASFATWMCPINCVEPARCPETRGPRDWSMPVAVQVAVDEAREAGTPYDAVAMFQTTHRTYGVGMFDADAARATDAAIRARAGQGAVRVLVASVSHCHGALAELRSVRG